tara:strand:+ start:1745 stop:1957 length:213 start_codon:yes stop_codon:yes gene_type:complete
MKHKYIIEHTYSYMKEFEVYSNKKLDDGDIIALCCDHQNEGFKNDNVIVKPFDDDLLDNNEWDIREEIND